MTETEHPIYRTSPQRTARMMAIMLGICIVGGAIFFSMWDYWISSPPAAAAGAETIEHEVQVAFTGVHIPVQLSFIESSDFRTLAFNALPGEPDNNPTINAEVGDEINFEIINAGKSFHAFGVTKETEGFGGILPGTDVGSASNPLKPGEGGSSSFVPGEEGIYYYICTVPGHREQGMVGQIIVGDVSEEPESPKPTTSMPVPGSEDVPEMIVEEEPEPVEEPPVTVSTPELQATPVMTEFTGTISIPPGSSVPGCEANRECYIPADVTISVGDTITWSNDDTAAHTVTSGTPDSGPDGTFDSSLFMSETTYEFTFDTAGKYDYFCMVHPWMTGIVTVN